VCFSLDYPTIIYLALNQSLIFLPYPFYPSPLNCIHGHRAVAHPNCQSPCSSVPLPPHRAGDRCTLLPVLINGSSPTAATITRQRSYPTAQGPITTNGRLLLSADSTRPAIGLQEGRVVGPGSFSAAPVQADCSPRQGETSVQW
jgi:hypothetical protein